MIQAANPRIRLKASNQTRALQVIRQYVLSGEVQPNVALPSCRELAKRFHISHMTVHRAMNTLAEERVVIRLAGGMVSVNPAAAAHLGIAPTLYVGDTQGHFEHAFYTALCAEAQDRGKAVTSFMPGDGSQAMDRFQALAGQHNRLICAETVWGKVRDAIPADVHVTRVSGYFSVGAVSSADRPGYVVSTDIYRGVKLAVEHLVSLGHRRIGLLDVGWQQDGDALLGRADPRRDSLLGYRAALQENGLQEEWLLIIPNKPDAGANWEDHQAQVIRRHLDIWSPLPTAVLAIADYRAAGLLRVLRERGLRVPDDMSVMGVGNTPWALAVDPPLTTICLGERQLARLAMILNEEPEPNSARVIRVDPELVVRKSTGVRKG